MRLRRSITMKKEGKIKFYSNSRGFGFITPNDGDEELFFHIHDVINFKQYEYDIQEGVAVKYEVGLSKKGLYAKDVVIEVE